MINDSIKILIAGDFSPHARVASLIDENNSQQILVEFESILKEVNYSIVNFESTLAPNESRPIRKCGPNLSGSKKSIEFLKQIGFSAVTLANNHSFDYGDKGLFETIQQLNNVGLDFMGAGCDLKRAQRIHFIDIKGQKIAFINICEHEFSIASEKSAGTGPLDIVDNARQIQEARKKADYVIVIVHGGHEHYPLPSPRMKKTYRYFIECGADTVVNHHQHCFSGYEIYKGRPIFYGLGNFCFDWEGKRNSIWNEGYAVLLTFCNKQIQYEMIPYYQCNEDACVHIIPQSTYQSKIEKLNSIIVDDAALQQEFEKFVQSKRKMLLDYAPYSSRICRKLVKCGLLPSFMQIKRVTLLLNRLECESHRDIMSQLLREKIVQ